jgi:NADH-quinone oxidoreductase subunit N
MSEIPDFYLAVPEIWLLSMACVVLVADLFFPGRDHAPAFYLSQLALVGAGLLALDAHWGVNEVSFSGTYIADSLSALLKVSVAGLAFIAFGYSRDYLRQRSLLQGEFFLIGLFGVLGMFVMSSAHNMLSLYLGLELLSLSLYTLVAYDRDSWRGSEAAMKYFVLGALSSGMLLYGMSMIYGAAGSLDLAEIAAAAAAPDQGGLLMAFGLVFVFVGVAFKFGAVPFHMWIPDVYQGAPTPSTLFVATAPKVAAIALFIRLVGEGLGGLASHWQDMAIILAIASLVLGNLMALVQTNIKRLLGYSTVSHIGFIFVGFAAASPEGYAAVTFYAITYAITTAAAFGVIILLSRRGFEAESIDDMRGLMQRHGGFAVIMIIVMFSLTGIPPTVGFYAKWLVLQAAVNAGLVWVAVIAVIAAVVGAFYYLRVLKAVCFDSPDQDTPAIQASTPMRVLLAVNGAAVLVAGIFPDTLVAACRAAFGLA